jgi:hypothetical protein
MLCGVAVAAWLVPAPALAAKTKSLAEQVAYVLAQTEDPAQLALPVPDPAAVPAAVDPTQPNEDALKAERLAKKEAAARAKAQKIMERKAMQEQRKKAAETKKAEREAKRDARKKKSDERKAKREERLKKMTESAETTTNKKNSSSSSDNNN